MLAKKTIDKVLKLIRKLNWEDESVQRMLHKVFTKPWKIKYGNVSLLAMLTYDLQRYHPAFAISVVDQVLEDVRRGLEQNVYSTNQQRIATMKFLGELYIYRLLASGMVFDTLWSLVTFGHRESHFPHAHAPANYSQRMGVLCLISHVRWICQTISSVSGLSVPCSTLAGCASIAGLKKRSWTIS